MFSRQKTEEEGKEVEEIKGNGSVDIDDDDDMMGTKTVPFNEIKKNGYSTNMVNNAELSHTIMVYVWDMDETLILLKSLLNGKYGEAFNGSKDIEKGVQLGKLWEDLILQVCDEHFYYKQIEDFNEPFIESLSEYDDHKDLSNYDFTKDSFSNPYDDANKRKLAYRYRAIADKYHQGLLKILNQETISCWNELYEVTDSYTDGWLSSARELLTEINEAPHSIPENGSSEPKQAFNVLVTSGALVPSIVKCLLFRLDGVIDARNVYSSWDVGKGQCFSWIKDRFSGQGVEFCVIGDGNEECEAAMGMDWPFIKIDMRPQGHHRFPGLSVRTMKHYVAVAYGDSDSDSADDD